MGVIEVVASFHACGPSALFAFGYAGFWARFRPRCLESFLTRTSVRLFRAFLVATCSLFGAFGSLLGTLLAFFVLVWPRVLRLFFSGRAEVKLLVPL